MPLLMRFRGFFYGLGMMKCGKDFQVTHDANIKVLEKIAVGKHVFIGNSSVLLGGGGIEIEDYVLIAPHVVIVSGNHTFSNGTFRYGERQLGKITLKKGSWIAANSTVTQGAVLPEASVLGANSLLNNAFNQSNALYGGVPAKWIKQL